MLVYTKGCYTLLGTIDSKSTESKYSFQVPISDNATVEVLIDPNKKIIESYLACEFSDNLIAALINDSKLDKKMESELSKIPSELSHSTRRVLKLIKYCLEQERIDESLFSVKGIYWSTDKTTWKPFPEHWIGILIASNSRWLNDDTEKIIQNYINSNFEPFFALRHLHRAKREYNPRYKWLDATIAAELAIKEFMINKSKEPSITALLLQMPSPPLGVLYGSVLQELTGEKSPKLDALDKGNTIRNKLIHRPVEQTITLQQANQYVQDVELAIYHLLSILYPNDANIRILYSHMSVE